MSTSPGSIGAAKSLGLAGPQSPTELCNVPTSVRPWDTREDRQDAYTPEEVLGVAGPSECVAMSLATVFEAKAHCQACGIATTASPNAESRRAVQASTVPAGNIGPQAAEAAEESAKDISSVGNLGPHVGNIGVVPQTAQAVEEDGMGTSGVCNIVPRDVKETKKMNESATCVTSVSNVVLRVAKKTTPPVWITKYHARSLGPNRHGRSKNNTMSSKSCPGVKYRQVPFIWRHCLRCQHRGSDIPLTAVSTPSGMLWEWLVMAQGLLNAPATFNRLTYFDDIFVYSRAEDGPTTLEVHLKHLRRVFEVLIANQR
ncbi:LOW QUALITY PROTEIN: Hypothetical protein PHPALM_4580 [Phytophthora palmivora]|uniref:Reverse transcriptase n=1 Tax=Phytophthora palmivora TaxID=4796 RepID=A0A2P4YJI1_9STRA|nr:LOW QUALITY PROTEIN: Hypothetical protein PHPALM_4580 [Phytophthora palmivora]